ncbi:SDR family oxidoreductase [Gordonia sp. OPL2]|uniref:SDR family oxidoreductase n=1 Tax=Gordonia sp. OPL2 TaxID=2486274 RepID=UPI00165525FC|nr:SDR family oxidoreductase [Gordonia sp. OPL2]ROZ89121.1 SDR family oxidoreductase [Gordonia sp. OPL2]
MASLSGKVAVITGAARGIGRATALSLSRLGTDLVLLDIDEPPLRDLADDIGADHAIARRVDVSDFAQVQAAVDDGVSRFGGIDLVLANAGMASYGSLSMVDPAAFARVVDVNLTGIFNTFRAALPTIIERKGYILVVSSAAAFVPLVGFSPYNASKAAVDHLAASLRAEVGFRGVAVGSAHMLFIDTPLVQDASADLPSFFDALDELPAPMRAIISVDDCAAAMTRGLARRSRRVYVPSWVALTAWLKPVLASRIMDRLYAGIAERHLARVDAEVASLHRFTSARNVVSGNLPPEETSTLDG